MLRLILGFFGYVKVPIEAVRLSMKIEDVLRIAAQKNEDFNQLYETSKTLTWFLRSGKLLNKIK